MNTTTDIAESRKLPRQSLKLSAAVAAEVEAVRARLLTEQGIDLSVTGAVEMLLRRGLGAIAADCNVRS